MIDHRTGGKLSSGSIILKSLASSLDVAAVKFNLNVSWCQNNEKKKLHLSARVAIGSKLGPVRVGVDVGAAKWQRVRGGFDAGS